MLWHLLMVPSSPVLYYPCFQNIAIYSFTLSLIHYVLTVYHARLKGLCAVQGTVLPLTCLSNLVFTLWIGTYRFSGFYYLYHNNFQKSSCFLLPIHHPNSLSFFLPSLNPAPFTTEECLWLWVLDLVLGFTYKPAINSLIHWMTLSRLNEAQNCLAQHHTPWRTQWIYILFYRFLYPYTLYYCCSQNFLPKASKHSIYHIIYIIRNLQKVHSAYLKVEDSSHLGGCLHLKTPLSFLLSTKKLLNLMAYFIFLMLPDFFASEHLIPQFPCFSNALLSV